jgi:hypothetical protein
VLLIAAPMLPARANDSSTRFSSQSESSLLIAQRPVYTPPPPRPAPPPVYAPPSRSSGSYSGGYSVPFPSKR